MKTVVKTTLFLILLFLSEILVAQTDSETIKKIVSFTNTGSPHVLIIDNISGSIEVEESGGSSVEIEAIKTIEGKTAEDVKRGISELKVVMKETGDSIIVHLESPFMSYKRTRQGHSYNTCNHDEAEYDYKVDFKVKVPSSVNLLVHTVNRGNIDVTGFKGPLQARNVNGAIYLKNIAQLSSAHTVNGDIEATFSNNPTQNADFKTINGKIKVIYKDDLSADVEVKSILNGEFYTDYPIAEYLPVKIEKREDNQKKKVYKISKATRVRIGKGGPLLTFETLNGNVYLSKKAS